MKIKLRVGFFFLLLFTMYTLSPFANAAASAISCQNWQVVYLNYYGSQRPVIEETPSPVCGKGAGQVIFRLPYNQRFSSVKFTFLPEPTDKNDIFTANLRYSDNIKTDIYPPVTQVQYWPSYPPNLNNPEILRAGKPDGTSLDVAIAVENISEKASKMQLTFTP